MPQPKKARARRTGRIEIEPRSSRGEPQWVSNMHAHYAKTGQYRSEDLHRVLGDARSQVGPRDTVDSLAHAAKK
jgi:hypothetical protein